MSETVKSARNPDTSAGAFDSRPELRARSPLPKSEPERRELARRSSAGVDVTLYWHPTLDEIIVSVCDEPNGAHFEIRPQRHLALDVYHHPYAYADLADALEDRPWMLRLELPAEGRQ
jgi:hypothetical protein